MDSSPYQEILAVLEAALECAASLNATAREADQLLQAGEVEQVQELYAARGEVIKMMVDLDQRLGESMNSARPALSGQEWSHLVETGGKLRDVLADTTELDGQNRFRLEAQCQAIAKELSRMRQGRQAANTYQSPQRASAEFTA